MLRPLLLVLALGGLGCAEAIDADAGSDTGAPDAPLDGGTDAPLDASSDAPLDASYDAADAPLPDGFIPLPSCRRPEDYVEADPDGGAAPSIGIVDTRYVPPCVRIPVGGSVLIEAESTHPLAPSRRGTPGTPIPAGATSRVEIVFDEPGFFPFFCPNHGSELSGMTGAVHAVP